MADGQIPAPESWRIAVFTNIPGGVIYSLVNEVVRPLGHRVVGVVTSPGPKRRRSPTYLEVVAAVPPGIDVIVSNHPERWAAMLAPLRPDLIISGGFPWRIPSEVIALPRLGAINMHPALLPRYRGPAAIEWALRNGDAELGFSVHRLAPDFDTGPILAQTRIPIADDDDINSLVARFGPCSQDSLGRHSNEWHGAIRVRPRMRPKPPTPACSMRSGGRSIGTSRHGLFTTRCVVGSGSETSRWGHWARSTARRCRLPRLACCQSSLSQVNR
jgi:hypothetical protein